MHKATKQELRQTLKELDALSQQTGQRELIRRADRLVSQAYGESQAEKARVQQHIDNVTRQDQREIDEAVKKHVEEIRAALMERAVTHEATVQRQFREQVDALREYADKHITWFVEHIAGVDGERYSMRLLFFGDISHEEGIGAATAGFCECLATNVMDCDMERYHVVVVPVPKYGVASALRKLTKDEDISHSDQWRYYVLVFTADEWAKYGPYNMCNNKLPAEFARFLKLVMKG